MWQDKELDIMLAGGALSPFVVDALAPLTDGNLTFPSGYDTANSGELEFSHPLYEMPDPQHSPSGPVNITYRGGGNFELSASGNNWGASITINIPEVELTALSLTLKLNSNSDIFVKFSYQEGSSYMSSHESFTGPDLKMYSASAVGSRENYGNTFSITITVH